MNIKIQKRIQLSFLFFLIAGILVCVSLIIRKYDTNLTTHIARPTLQTLSPTLTKFESRVRMESSVIRFERDLETSISIQELPNIQLDLYNSSGFVQSIDLGVQTQDALSKTWRTTLRLCLANSSLTDTNLSLEIQKTYLNSNALAIQNLEDVSINTHVGTRNLTENEATELVTTLNKLAIQRFEELNSMNNSFLQTKFSKSIFN